MEISRLRSYRRSAADEISANLRCQTLQSVRDMGNRIADLADQLYRTHAPVRVLDVLYDMGGVTQEARRLVVELAKELEYERLAMVGRGGAIRLGANLMLHATGKGDKVNFFTDYDEAIAWLLR